MEQRRCPGVSGQRCHKFMCAIDRDNHPLCPTCRGKECSRDDTCDVCVKWGEREWIYFETRRRRYKTSDILKPVLASLHVSPSSVLTAPRSETSESSRSSVDRAPKAPMSRSPVSGCVSPDRDFSALARSQQLRAETSPAVAASASLADRASIASAAPEERSQSSSSRRSSSKHKKRSRSRSRSRSSRSRRHRSRSRSRSSRSSRSHKRARSPKVSPTSRPFVCSFSDLVDSGEVLVFAQDPCDPAPRPSDHDPAPRPPLEDPAPRPCDDIASGHPLNDLNGKNSDPDPRYITPDPAPRSASPDPAPRSASPDPAPRPSSPDPRPHPFSSLFESGILENMISVNTFNSTINSINVQFQSLDHKVSQIADFVAKAFSDKDDKKRDRDRRSPRHRRRSRSHRRSRSRSRRSTRSSESRSPSVSRSRRNNPRSPPKKDSTSRRRSPSLIQEDSVGGGRSGPRFGPSVPLQEKGGNHRAPSSPPGDQEDTLIPERQRGSPGPSMEEIQYIEVLSYIKETNNIPEPSVASSSKDFSALRKMMGSSETFKSVTFPASPMLVGHTEAYDGQVKEFSTQKLIQQSSTRVNRYYELEGSEGSSSFNVSRHVEPMCKSAFEKVKKSSVTLSHSELASVESSAQQTLQAFSYLDWWFSSASQYSKRHLPQESQPFMDRLFQSAVKCLSYGTAAAARTKFNIMLKHRDAVLNHLHSSVSNEDIRAMRASKLPVDNGELFDSDVCLNALQQYHVKTQVEASTKAAQSWKKPTWKPRPFKPSKFQQPRGGISPVVPPVQDKGQSYKRPSRPTFRGQSKPSARGRGDQRKNL